MRETMIEVIKRRFNLQHQQSKPEWACYAAQDQNGDWYWHEYKPEIFDEVYGHEWISANRVQKVANHPDRVMWKDSMIEYRHNPEPWPEDKGEPHIGVETIHGR